MRMQRADTLVLYHYFERDPAYIDNFLHFMLFGYQPKNDYIVVIAGDCSIDLPQLENVRYVRTPNRNGDYGGYAAAIHQCEALDYDYFVFINCSVRGPYLAATTQRSWTSLFTQPLSEDLGLFGSSIAILSPGAELSVAYQRAHGGSPPYSHVQSMAYAMHRAAFEHLRNSGFYELKAPMDKRELIVHYELRQSQLLQAAGWNIGCLLPEYQLDYRRPHQDLNPSAREGDAHHPLAYFGRTLHPFELVFIKTHRGLTPPNDLERLAASALAAGAANPQALAEPALADYARRVTQLARNSAAVSAAPMAITPQELLALTQRLINDFPEMARQMIEFVADSPHSDLLSQWHAKNS